MSPADAAITIAARPADRALRRVALSGPRGSFSESAARQLVPGKVQLVPCRDFDAALGAVQAGEADAAVLPRENTLIGTITSALDAVLDRSMRIVAETVVRVEHHLVVVPGARLTDVTRVHSHPAALAQCRGFLRTHPDWAVRHEADTATSVQLVMTAVDRAGAAIASRDAAAIYGGVILQSHLEDSSRNSTRFALLVPGDTPWPVEADTVSLEVVARHEAGALVTLLGVFAQRGLSVLTIETRPDPDHPWRLRFVVDVCARGRPVDWDAIEHAVRPRVERLRVLGRYQGAAMRALGFEPGPLEPSHPRTLEP